jgi:DNA-binding MarR family transcriptional regulator
MHTANVVAAYVASAQDRLHEGMRRAELEPRELAALTLIAQHDGCSVEWLRVRIELSQSGTVRLVDRLCARDLVRRGAAAGRGVPLHATAMGVERLDAWGDARDDIVEKLLVGIPPDLRSILIEAMAATLEGTERERAQADAACRTCTWVACGTDCPVDRSVPVENAGTGT